MFATVLARLDCVILVLVVLLALLFLAGFKFRPGFRAWFKAMLKSILAAIRAGDKTMERILNFAGYAYDAKQDIFYSTMDACQRDFGYCRLYDEAAAPLNMIIDCEPVYFSYAGKRWMIELWKGQYAMATGCEIGVYNTTRPDLVIPGLFTGPFFDCAGDEEMLYMSYTAKKNGKVLFTREDRHWWLTGFILGEFSEPWEITMDVSIELKDNTMRDSFMKGLIEAGYHLHEINIDGKTVSLNFDKTRTPQPYTRTPVTDWLIQRKNEFLCKKFQKLTGSSPTTSTKIKALKRLSPEIYAGARKLGRHEEMFKSHEIIKRYLDEKRQP